LLTAASVFFEREASPMNHDAAIVVRAGDSALLDLNDARLFAVELREIRRRVGGRIDAFAFQGAGASWYPMCYGYEREEEHRLAARKRSAKLQYTAKCLDVLQPAVALPFAGPPAFLDRELFRHNAQQEDGVFPDQAQVADWLADRGHACQVLLPGDGWDTARRAREPDPVWAGFRFGDRWPYLEAYAERRSDRVAAVLARYPAPRESLWDRFHDYFTSLVDMSPYFDERIGMQVGFDVTGPGGGRWSVDFSERRVRPHPVDGAPHVTYRLESRWLAPILDGAVPWEDFMLSMRFAARREPDRYNDHLLGLLKFAEPEALRAVETYERTLEGARFRSRGSVPTPATISRRPGRSSPTACSGAWPTTTSSICARGGV
jgi:UDP-MurNAc hydroxylase